MPKSKLELYVGALDKALAGNCENFRALLCHGLRMFEVNDQYAAVLLGVSRPSITRWRSGDVRPHPKMCREVLTEMRSWAVAKIQDTKQSKLDGPPDPKVA